MFVRQRRGCMVTQLEEERIASRQNLRFVLVHQFSVNRAEY